MKKKARMFIGKIPRTLPPIKKQLRVWWIPQVPMKAFRVPVATVKMAKRILEVLADYDLFQFNNKVKPDYFNAGGLEVLEDCDGTGKEDWCEWYCDDCGEDVDGCECK